MAKSTKSRMYDSLNFNIDTYLNPIVPASPLHRLPKPISHFLGVRSKPHEEPPAVLQWILTFIATVAGLSLVGGVYSHAPQIHALHPPSLVASLGATAVLDYAAMRSPLSQPRNSVLGQTISAIVGVAISKCFQHSPAFFASYPWVAGAIGCACASLAMSVTNTVHPPGGATAVLAATSAEVVVMGWWFVPVVMVGTLLMLATALIINNLGRQFPVYWWTSDEVGGKLRKAKREEQKEEGEVDGGEVEKQVSQAESDRTLRHEFSNNVSFDPKADEICIMPFKMVLPSHIEITPEEVRLLSGLQERIRAHDIVGT